MKKILFLGPVTNLDKGLVGGATISFGQLTDYFSRENWPIKVLNTKKYFGFASSFSNAISLLFSLFQFCIWADVIFLNSSRGGAKYLAPIVFVISRIFGKKFIFRPFGGDIAEYTKGYGRVAQFVFKKTILKADIFYLQTEALMHFYLDSNANAKQLRTSRKKPLKELHRLDHTYARKYIYLGFINESKGIRQIIEAAEKLGTSYIFHIYGPIKDEHFNNISEEIYKGTLDKHEVLAKMREYDVLLLPTFYEGEGYPGAIIEAYSLGLPVIATAWRAIPEVVKEGETGLLIEPRSTESLINAIKNMDNENYEAYSRNALDYFSDTFDQEIVLEQVKKDILAL